MSPEKFVAAIKAALVDDVLEQYKILLAHEDQGTITDPYWKDTTQFYAGLQPSEKEVLLQIIRQTQIDTISGFLGILDGSSWLDADHETLTLNTNKSKEPLNGELQDIFLMSEE